MEHTTRVVGFSIGWVAAENAGRVLYFWIGAWALVEFDPTYLCMALGSNASLLFMLNVLTLVDLWYNKQRKRGASDQRDSQTYLQYAVGLTVGYPMVHTLVTHFLGEWPALALKFAVAILCGAVLRRVSE